MTIKIKAFLTSIRLPTIALMCFLPLSGIAQDTPINISFKEVKAGATRVYTKARTGSYIVSNWTCGKVQKKQENHKLTWSKGLGFSTTFKSKSAKKMVLLIIWSPPDAEVGETPETNPHTYLKVAHSGYRFKTCYRPLAPEDRTLGEWTVSAYLVGANEPLKKVREELASRKPLLLVRERFDVVAEAESL